ncbi:MAG: EMC3/TMCO1 family protein [Candidatus Nanohalobium sp.]
MVFGIQFAALLTPLYTFYDSFFQPLLAMGPYVSLGFFSAALAGIFSLIYWWLLDTDRADEIKEKLEHHQDKMKEARQNDESDKASKHMSKTLKLNQKFMMLNFKPMIATMIFVAFIFPWLGSTYSPTVGLHSTGNHTFTGNISYAGQVSQIQVVNKSEPVIKFDGQQAKLHQNFKTHGITWEVMNFMKSPSGSNSDAKLSINAVFIPLPGNYPLVGNAVNWLGFYLILMMPLSYLFRKALGVQ